MSLQRWPLGFNDSPSYAAPLTPWASFPAALTAEGQIRRPAELPHVELIAIGGIWRPRGGRQVLAQRSTNPVTVQSTVLVPAETLGPFPGGLVRAGMRLHFDFKLTHGAIGNPNRNYHLRIGKLGNTQLFAAATVGGGTVAVGRVVAVLDVLFDTSAAHQGSFNGSAGIGYGIGNAFMNPTVDFSQSWMLEPWLSSNTETPVTITGASWSAGVATYTTSAAHTLAVGDKDVIGGITPSGYNTNSNGAIVTAIGSSTQFSIAMPVDPGTYTSGGTSARISNMQLMAYQLAMEG